MPVPHFEIPSGAVNGVNATFFSSVPYKPGTLALYVNGQLAAFDSFTESDPTIGKFTVAADCIPQSSPPPPDELAIFYLDTTNPHEVIRDEIFGEVSDLPEGTIGVVSDLEPILGLVGDGVDGVAGTLLELEAIGGVVADVDGIQGVIGDC